MGKANGGRWQIRGSKSENRKKNEKRKTKEKTPPLLPSQGRLACQPQIPEARRPSQGAGPLQISGFGLPSGFRFRASGFGLFQPRACQAKKVRLPPARPSNPHRKDRRRHRVWRLGVSLA